MTAQVTIDSSQYDLLALGQAAGQPDASKMSYVDGDFIVEDIDQSALDDAVAAATPRDLVQEIKEEANVALDDKAAEVRKRFISCGDGIEMTYMEKREEATAFKDAGYPEAQIADYPFIEAEAIATDDTGTQAADAILAQCTAWKVAGAEIEKQRRLGKVQIEQQLGVGGVETARDNALAALDAITP